MKDYSYGIASVKKAFNIIEILAANNGSMGVSQIADKLDSHVSSVSRFLITFQELGYVDKDTTTNKYYINDKIFEISNKLLKQHPLTLRYVDAMYAISYEHNISAHISSFHGTKRYVLHKDTRIKSLNMTYAYTDSKKEHYCSSPGKMLLAQYTDEQLDEYFKSIKLVKFQAGTLATEEEIRVDLDRVRQQGYSVHDEEYILGAVAISLPLYVGDTVSGCLTIMGPKSDMIKLCNRETIESIRNTLHLAKTDYESKMYG